MSAAGWVSTRAGNIIDAFDRGVVIRARGGRFLAIPTSESPKLIAGADGKRRRATPENWERRFRRKLKFVARPYGGILIEEVQATRGRNGPVFRRPSAKALRTGRGLVSRTIFVLIRQARIPRRLNIDRAADRALNRLPGKIMDEWLYLIGD